MTVLRLGLITQLAFLVFCTARACALEAPTIILEPLESVFVDVSIDLTGTVGMRRFVRSSVVIERACDEQDFERLAKVRSPEVFEQISDFADGAESCEYRAIFRGITRRGRRFELISNPAHVLFDPNTPDPEVTPPPVDPPSNPGFIPLNPGQSECPADSARRVLDRINYYRSQNGRTAVTQDRVLAAAARIHTVHMATINTLTHEGWFDAVLALGYQGSTFAQNIANIVSAPVKLVDMWMAMPGHRANLLNANVAELGVGCVVDPAGRYWWAADMAG
ncbi:MAG: CAP domain-containing protein [Oligoflexia bacterium]|nr:CAP domain-containing protein [Oligoflexia bacterium]